MSPRDIGGLESSDKLLCAWLAVFIIWISQVTGDSDLRGPGFLMEPPSRVEFSNSSGAWVDCSASGSPTPHLEWTTGEGSTLGDVPGVRRVMRNGTLALLPFSADAFRQDIHSTVYRCSASNSHGRIISRDVQVRAVVVQSYKVRVEVAAAARGCTAVLQCVVDRGVKDLVRVVAWVQDPSFFIYPSLQGDGKFHVLPTGELLVHNLEFSDQFPSYRCRTRHKLTRHVEVSSPANIRLAENRGIISPSILDHTGTVQVSVDEGAVLVCIAQGCPTPEYRWYQLAAGYEPLGLVGGPRTRVLGAVLAVEAVTEEDAGLYRCAASNAGGEASAELRLAVSEPLHVQITPSEVSVPLGGSAELRCVVTPGGPHLLTWYKDGRMLPGRGSPNDVLLLSSISREDQGMYQCLVRRAEGETAQAAASLQLGDASPVLSYSFIEQTLQPGPAVSLKCSASGNPTPSISWALDGFPLPKNSRFVIGQYVTIHGDVISHVNISSVSVDDGGEYSCSAENRAGKAVHSARLNVYGLPYIRVIPKVTAVAGEDFELKCPVAGYPIEEIRWERGGRELPEDLRQRVLPGGILKISPVQKASDAGLYTCWARNKQGQTARRTGEVTVIVPPKLSPIIPDRTLNVGDRASLTCSVTKGDLPLTITWLKDGRPMDLQTSGGLQDTSGGVSVTHVDRFNSILLVESLSPEHNGNYTCVAANPAAQVMHTQRLVVNVPPIIEPFSFPSDGLTEASRTRVVCGVSRGDPPLVIHWLKDDAPLVAGEGVNLTSLDQYSSLLSVASLGSQHSGVYTCVATNPAKQARYSSKLQVKVPPRWSIEPVDASVERNRHVVINCQAQGVPEPTITWKKATGSKSGEYQDMRDRQHTKLLGNGSLLLQHVKEDREGFYLCQANNGIGSGIGKVIQLKVKSSPYFSAPSRIVTVKKGDTATLNCKVEGDTPINIHWMRGGKIQLTPATNYRVSVKQEVTSEGVVGELEIVSVESGDSGAYFCQASNLYGRDQQLVQLLVQEPPASPTDLKVAMVNSQSVNLQWQHSGAETGEVNKYVLQYREGQGEDGTWQQVELNGQIRGTLLEHLKPATQYTLRVLAEGPAGRSQPSREVAVETQAQRPSGPPQAVQARPISPTQVLVTWTAPKQELRHGQIMGYFVGHKEISAGSGYNMTNVRGEMETELLLSGLAKYTRYSIVVQAYNQVGQGPMSEPLPTQTFEDVPSMPPEDVRCTALSAQSLQVSWQPPAPPHANGIIQGYKVFYDTLEKGFEGSHDARKTTAMTIVLTGLHRFANYSMSVLAYTRVGDGVQSSPIYCHTEEDAPGSPADIKVVVSSPNSLMVSWLPPNEPNGVVTKYTLYTRVVNGEEELNHGKRNVGSGQLSYEARNLQQHVEYQYWVTASTRIGEGQSSKVVAQVPTNRVPARITSFGTPVWVAWRGSVTLHCSAVGQPAPRRGWLRDGTPITVPQRNVQLADSTGELVLTSLQRAGTGNYTCHVENNLGADSVSYYLVVQVAPSAPTLFVRSATSSSILIQWRHGDTGGSAITRYTLNYRRAHEDPQDITLSRHSTTHELKNLLCGSTYHMFLLAHNKLGVSPPSSTISVRTQGQAPGMPPGSQLLAPNSTHLLLRLHVWPDNQCPLLYFSLRYRLVNNVEWVLVSNSLKPQRRFTITGLEPATEYVLHIEAYNVAGSTNAEYTFFTLTKDGELPGPELVRRGAMARGFYFDIRLLLPVLLATLALLAATTTVLLCRKSRPAGPLKESLDNQQNAAAQRERYYATIHKVPLQATSDKIPETSEDISPYATFQLADANNTLLHSFMYHEQALAEGCASPPPPGPTSQKLRRARRRSSRKTDADESDESDSDPDQLTSSRTESSNHLDAVKGKHSYIYHGAQSSTSSDISPMSEQKSLPRRGGRSRWLPPSKTTMRNSLSIAETSFRTTGSGGPELSEAECDIDTLKKLKLGIRSSLWSRPGGGGGSGGGGSSHAHNPHHSDYSIAV